VAATYDDQDAREYLQRLGTVIAGRYVLGDLLGIGGMGVVYAAIQRPAGRTVAIKLPRRELASDPAVRERLHTEALAASRIAHRNVVRMLDFGDADGAPYLVMEHLVGVRLSELVVEGGAMPAQRAVSIVRQLLAGLARAHACGVIHADVTCDNVLVETLRDGTAVPRLIDFGIARFIDDPCAGCADHERLVLGTPTYLAPEVIRGESPTFASDVYAAGTILYQLLTGATPFAGETCLHVMTRQLEDPAVPPSWRCPDAEISMALDEVIGRALAKQPAERFPDAAAFGVALEQADPSCAIAELPDLCRISAPAAFSTLTKTVTMNVECPRGHTSDHRPSMVEQRRDAVATATLSGDPGSIVIAYLDLALARVDEHELAVAISELEEGVALLLRTARSAPGGPAWRLLLTLASFYDRVGDRERACMTTRVAHDHARRAGSTLGKARARQLFTRLAGGGARGARQRTC
jgi:serine/threonine protein kinase